MKTDRLSVLTARAVDAGDIKKGKRPFWCDCADVAEYEENGYTVVLTKDKKEYEFKDMLLLQV